MLNKALYELTNPQKNIWQLEQVNNHNNYINSILSYMKLQGNLDIELLDKTLNIIIEKNDSFRIKFLKKGNNLFQYIDDFSYTHIPVEISQTDNISSFIEKYNNVVLSLENLFAFFIVSTPNFTYVFYKAHHIISDAWGMTQVAEQVKEIYSLLVANQSIDNFSRVSYVNFINRESNYLTSKKYDSDLQFWDDYSCKLTSSKLFNKFDLFQKQATRFEYSIDENLSKKILDFCSKHNLTEYSFFLGVYSLFFSKYYDSEHIVFGTPFLNRQKRLKELEGTGMYVSTLPLNIEIPKKISFIDFCKNINSLNLQLFRHSNFPFHKIQELYSSHFNDTSPLYEIGFSYQINHLTNKLENNDTGLCNWVFSGEQNNPLTIHLSKLNGNTLLFYDFMNNCFNLKEIKHMNSIICHIIFQIINGETNLHKLNLITDEDQRKLIAFNSSGNILNSNFNNVVDIFNNIVHKYSNDIALIFNDTTLTYSELDNCSNIIANKLLKTGIKKNTPIALFFDKSFDMIISMLATLKIGCAYVPILPDEDPERIKYILNDCKPMCILTHNNYDEVLPHNYTIINIEKYNYSYVSPCINTTILPTDVAYIIYTSGSTGNPKGTMVMHKNICSLKESIENDVTLKATNKDTSISLLKYSFDASGIDIYTSLLFGGKLLLVEKSDELNPEKVIKIIEKYRVTRSFLIPKWIEHIAIQDKLLNADLSSLRILGTGGETLKPYILENLLSKYSNLKVLNLYGPTETTMFTTCKVVSLYEIKNNYTSIGKPIFGSRLGVINSNLEFLPTNVSGELIIYEDSFSIKNIAKGYLNLPDQTKNKFINLFHPILKKTVKAYRTGDIVKINDNLEIEFIGRDDDIVKVNGGYLVALNEVEKKIQTLLGNKFETYPIAIPYKNTKVIILFFTTSEKNISIYNIKSYINSNISFYMKPKQIIKLEEFPRNSSGKINRKKLKEIATSLMEENKKQRIAPKTKTEKKLYNYIKNLIGNDDFSITDDFIDDLGIDSLSLTSIYTYLEKYKINIQDIYNKPNIQELSKFIDSNASSKLEPDLNDISKIEILNNVHPFDLGTVLITGVTGFLGIHLLKTLLLSDKVNKIYCIVRNKIKLEGKTRLLNNFNYYFSSDNKLLNLFNEKVTVLNGDITKTLLGLDKKTYDIVQSKVTTVINSAANVRHFVKPKQIMKDNVQSIDNILAFCKKNISLAHISTLSIAAFKGDFTENKIFDENSFFINQDFANKPYLISKFEAEKHILMATNFKKLNAIIFRVGNIMPRYSDGVFQFNANQNVFLSALKSIIDTKLVAKDFLNIKLEFSPVDECSYFIIKLLENNFNDSIYHILNDKEISINELKTLLNFLNYDIVECDLKTFVTALDKNTDEYTKEYILGNNLNSFSQKRTLSILSKLNLEWSKIDIEYINKVLTVIKNFNKDVIS